MFGLGRSTPRHSRGAVGGHSKVRGVLLAGAGLLAYRWWQNRKNESALHANRAGNGSTSWSSRPRTGESSPQGGFAAGGTTPGGSAF